MSEKLSIQVAPLRKHILCSDRETVNQILVAVQPGAEAAASRVESNIMLVLDDSGSMSGVPIDHVLHATRAIVGQLGVNDNLGIIGFGDDVEVVHPIVHSAHRDSLLRVTSPQVWGHGRRGYGTNMALAIDRAWDELLRAGDARRMNRMILLTDGYSSNPEQTLEVAERVSADRVSIVPLGFGGQFDMDFMDRIAGWSGGACEYIDPNSVDAAIGSFLDQLRSIQNQITDNTRIRLRFRGEHRITDFFQTWPKVIYHGLTRLDAERSWEHRLAAVERSDGIEVLFTVVHPPAGPGRALVAEVDVTYDMPGSGIYDETISAQAIIEYTDSQSDWLRVDGRVQRRYADAFVEKQQTRARQLVAAGQHDDAVRVLGTIRKRGDERVRALAEGTIRKIQQGGVDNESMFELKMGTQKKRRGQP